MNNPKVFISHASEDKDKFVLDFATKLRKAGIDAWVDKWEMNPGDSLIDKIFEAIKNAKAFIVILSENSVNKAWVREELNAGMVKKIQGSTNLIPVLIDSCEVPECLKSTKWEKIENIADYEVELKRIVGAICGVYEKPPLGHLPSYTQSLIDIIPGLTKIDSLILKLSCEADIESNYSLIKTESIHEKVKPFDIPPETFYESIEVLDSKGYIKGKKLLRRSKYSGDTIGLFTISLFGFEEYARTYIDNYPSIIDSVAFQIINFNEMKDVFISQKVNQPLVLVRHILNVLENGNLIKCTHLVSGEIRILNVSAELKRRLRQI